MNTHVLNTFYHGAVKVRLEKVSLIGLILVLCFVGAILVSVYQVKQQFERVSKKVNETNDYSSFSAFEKKE